MPIDGDPLYPDVVDVAADDFSRRCGCWRTALSSTIPSAGLDAGSSVRAGWIVGPSSARRREACAGIQAPPMSGVSRGRISVLECDGREGSQRLCGCHARNDGSKGSPRLVPSGGRRRWSGYSPDCQGRHERRQHVYVLKWPGAIVGVPRSDWREDFAISVIGVTGRSSMTNPANRRALFPRYVPGGVPAGVATPRHASFLPYRAPGRTR